MNGAPPDQLRIIRQRIDALDETVHRSLIERAGIIAELIRVKGTSAPGAAFRPDREADMMRRLVLRHESDLPLVTVEHIWREIISTFTAMQAPYGVATAPAADPLAMRDLVRFYFGFFVSVHACDSAADAIALVEGEGRDLALVPLETEGRWWRSLTAPDGPGVFARLPFIEEEGRPASLPAYVVGPPLKDAAPADVQLLATAARDGLHAAISSLGGRVIGEAEGETLFELQVSATLDDLARELGAPLGDVLAIGQFAQPIRVVVDRTPELSSATPDSVASASS
ncbi:Chorismate mutase [Faunimonas pinastri]|uniref:chorismate mutase n=1 Tax=Faunimonas pinastri TaxID=1855383 RepID=A0A1H9HTW1_9HYPH|nr:chorismate mutase [Faunimonas pinastri]SEQ65692.1 Chorismate mutase [Faunimonas pinastri]